MQCRTSHPFTLPAPVGLTPLFRGSMGVGCLVYVFVFPLSTPKPLTFQNICTRFNLCLLKHLRSVYRSIQGILTMPPSAPFLLFYFSLSFVSSLPVLRTLQGPSPRVPVFWVIGVVVNHFQSSHSFLFVPRNEYPLSQLPITNLQSKIPSTPGIDPR